MMFVIKTIQGDSFKINETEYKAISNSSPDQSILLKDKGIMIKKSMVAIIYPEGISKDIEKDDQKTGRLHDGLRVKKHFGQWVSNNEVIDDKGNYSYSRIDPEYYPEVALDRVATESEYEIIRQDGFNYYDFLGIGGRKDRLNTGFKSIAEIL